MTESWPDHDWNFAYQHTLFSVFALLTFNRFDASHSILLSICNLLDLHCTVELCLVSHATYASNMRPERVVRLVSLRLPWMLVNCRVAKGYLVRAIFIVLAMILFTIVDCLGLELLDDLLHRKHHKPLKGEDLLGHQSILLEVTIDDLPAVIQINWAHISTWRHIFEKRLHNIILIICTDSNFYISQLLFSSQIFIIYQYILII